MVVEEADDAGGGVADFLDVDHEAGEDRVAQRSGVAAGAVQIRRQVAAIVQFRDERVERTRVGNVGVGLDGFPQDRHLRCVDAECVRPHQESTFGAGTQCGVRDDLVQQRPLGRPHVEEGGAFLEDIGFGRGGGRGTEHRTHAADERLCALAGDHGCHRSGDSTVEQAVSLGEHLVQCCFDLGLEADVRDLVREDRLCFPRDRRTVVGGQPDDRRGCGTRDAGAVFGEHRQNRHLLGSSAEVAGILEQADDAERSEKRGGDDGDRHDGGDLAP